jgi:hypothetical protein
MPNDVFEGMSRAERERLCAEVLERLSDYVEATAPEDFCRRVEQQLAGCQPFEAYCNTLAATIALARACDEPPEALNERYERCVEVVRRRLEER